MERQRGFTLIELLVVIMIIVLLMGMLMPMIGMARRSAAITSTRSLIKRVSTALEAFRSDVGTYPYQDHAAVAFPEPNRLAYHLAHDMTPSELTDLRNDAATAFGRFDPSSSFGTMVLQKTQLDPREASTEDATQSGIAATINRMAATRGRVAIYAGATAVTGFKAWGGYDHAAERLVPNATTRGFARDYLGDELSPKEIRGDAIIDRWGQPLVYICPVLPGLRRCYAPDSMGRSVEDGKYWRPDAVELIDGETYGLGQRGRAETTTLAGDARATSARAFVLKPEIWSSGPDRRCSEQREDRANADNISVEPYTRGLR
jgi:prepilin-type N-terminal cleavage/methylation domain-containing protein